jgi:nitrogenase molybdenum-cofactor synthesis protein NifE
MAQAAAIDGRQDYITTKGRQISRLKCDDDSIAGAVSQRACVYCGARVVLNPITDAVHLVHGPIGCASYTWDIRGSLTSGADLYRNSFSTDLQERDIIFGGEKKLAAAIDELVAKYSPKLVFIYATCIVGVIGDDLEAVARAAASRHGIEVIPVQSSGFAGNKAAGYRAACDALFRLVAPGTAAEAAGVGKDMSINYLGDFNLAGEAWIIRDYLAQIGVEINTVFTGDASYGELKKATRARLNVMQCAGSMAYLAGRLEEAYGIPSMRVSFLGLADTADSLRRIAAAMGGGSLSERAEELIVRETARVRPVIDGYRAKLAGRKAAVYVGGGFKAISLIKQFRELGIEVVMVGTQTGRKEEYETIDSLVADGTVILDDANPAELERFMTDQGADLLVGGVKERPLAYKLGKAFIDHNHDRKHPLSGFIGAVNFAAEVYTTLCSPVWRQVKTGGDLNG